MTTITTTLIQPTVLSLQFQSFSSRLREIITQMLQSPLFSKETKDKIRAWEKEFFKNDPNPVVLSLFIFDFLSKEQHAEAIELEKSLRTLLRSLLPPETNLDHYIAGNKLRKIVDQMLQSDLYSEEIKAQIQAWEREFFANDFPRAINRVAIRLSLLITDYLYAFLEKASQKQQNEILDFEEELKPVLSLLLPIGTDVDQYIKENAQFSNEEAEVTDQIIVLFNKCLETLSSSGDKAQHQLQEGFNRLKARLKEIKLSREAAQTIAPKVVALAAQVEKIRQTLLSNCKDADQMAKEFAIEKAFFDQLLGECNELLNKL